MKSRRKFDGLRGKVTSTFEEETEESNEPNGDEETGYASNLEVLYNDDPGEEIPLDQGVYAPSHLKT